MKLLRCLLVASPMALVFGLIIVGAMAADPRQPAPAKVAPSLRKVPEFPDDKP